MCCVGACLSRGMSPSTRSGGMVSRVPQQMVCWMMLRVTMATWLRLLLSRLLLLPRRLLLGILGELEYLQLLLLLLLLLRSLQMLLVEVLVMVVTRVMLPHQMVLGLMVRRMLMVLLLLGMLRLLVVVVPELREQLKVMLWKMEMEVGQLRLGRQVLQV